MVAATSEHHDRPVAVLPFAVNMLYVVAGDASDRPDPSIRRTEGALGDTERSSGPESGPLKARSQAANRLQSLRVAAPDAAPAPFAQALNVG